MLRFVAFLLVLAALTAVYIMLPFLNMFFGVGNVIFVCCAIYGLSCVINV